MLTGSIGNRDGFGWLEGGIGMGWDFQETQRCSADKAGLIVA